MKAGVALFDSPEAPQGGWAACADEGTFAFRHPGDLPSESLWITNCGFKAFQGAGLRSAGNLADSQYLRTRTDALLAEIGLPSVGAEAAAAAAPVAERCVALAGRMGEVRGAYRLAHTLRGVLVTKGMRRRPCQAIAGALANAMQINQAMRASPVAGAASRTYLVPRAHLSRWLLTRPVPAPEADWQAAEGFPKRPFGHVDGTALQGTAAAVQWLAALPTSGRTGLFRISVRRTHPDFAPFATFAAGFHGVREWAAWPEVLHLARFSEVRILEAHLAPAAPCALPKDVVRMMESPWMDLAFGLFLENLLAAYALQESDGRPIAAAVWQRAYDRALTSRYAEVFAEHSITVGSHAYGRLIAFVRSGDEAVADEVARGIGLIPQATRP